LQFFERVQEGGQTEGMWIPALRPPRACDNRGMTRVHSLSIGAILFFAFTLLVPQAAAAAQIQVGMGPNQFLPTNIIINAGDTVVWTNSDSMAHTVTASDNSYDSGILQPGARFSRVFTQPGTYTYRCILHPGMSGTITVVAPNPQYTPPPSTPPPTSSSQADQLRAQAAALLERIKQLQQQVAGGSSASPSSCPRVGMSLKLGSSGEDVRRLQQFLAQDPSVYPERMVTGYYGALTEAAVKRWQTKYNVVSSGTAATTGFGVVGPRTAAAMALLCAQGGSGGGGGGGGGGGVGPVGGFIQVTPITGPAPLTISAQATVNTVNSCSGAVYTLDWGDGSIPTRITVGQGHCSQMVQILSHTYQYGGTYTITLSAGPHSTTATVTVSGPPKPTTPPQPDTLSAEPTSGTKPLTVNFTGIMNGSLSCAGGTYTLTYGDGESTPLPFDASTCASRTFEVSHTYLKPGEYTAALRKGSGASAPSVATKGISVTGKMSGFAPMTINPSVGGNPLVVEVIFEGGCATYTLTWGDGGNAQTGECPDGNKTMTHTYAQNGSYTITLTRGNQTDSIAYIVQ